MKLSISNIAWKKEDDPFVYELMGKYEFSGLEIAPTRLITHDPYNHIPQAVKWAQNLRENFGFEISSMQSIWFGKKERLFYSEDERNILLEYTKKAIDFSSNLNCRNIVFGCPKNRIMPEKISSEIGVTFFGLIGNYAASKGTTIGIEANPLIYETNYINDTSAALQLIENVNSVGFKLNLDIGTMIENNENIDILQYHEKQINHVHISEPWLSPIKPRQLHKELKQYLSSINYNGYISIEMKNKNDLLELEKVMNYIREVFS